MARSRLSLEERQDEKKMAALRERKSRRRIAELRSVLFPGKLFCQVGGRRQLKDVLFRLRANANEPARGGVHIDEISS